MPIPADKRVAQRIGMNAMRGSNCYIGASPSGPQGSATMMFGVVFTPKRSSVTLANYLFNCRTGGGNTGWMILYSSTGIQAVVANAVPNAFVSGPQVLLPSGLPAIVIAQYLGSTGTISFWVNGVASVPVSSGTGYQPPVGAPTCIGSRTSAGTNPCPDVIIHECFHLNAYDVTATVAALTLQWQINLQGGQYLDWPRAMTADDHYWSARDAQAGLHGAATWVDRGPNAVSLPRTGAPQMASYPMVF